MTELTVGKDRVAPTRRLKKSKSFNEDVVTDEDISRIESSAYRAYDDLMTPSEEAISLVHRIQEYLSITNPRGYIPWRDYNKQEAVHSYLQLTAIRKKLCINPDGSAVPLTLRQRLFHKSPLNRLVAKINHAQRQAGRLEADLQSFTDAEDTLKNTYLLQHFVLGTVCSYDIR